MEGAWGACDGDGTRTGSRLDYLQERLVQPKVTRAPEGEKCAPEVRGKGTKESRGTGDPKTEGWSMKPLFGSEEASSGRSACEDNATELACE